MNILSLRDKRANLWDNAKKFWNEHTDGDGLMTTKDAAAYDKMIADIDTLNDQIYRMEKQESMDNYLSAPAAVPILNRPNAGDTPTFSGHAKPGIAGDEYRKNFLTAFRTGFKQAQNYLHTADPVQGGYLLPEEFDSQLVMKLADDNVFRQISKVITTASEHQINLVASEPSASWVSEGDEIQLGDAQFGRVSLKAYKLAVGSKISSELLTDSYYDLEAALIEMFSRSIATAEEQIFISGNGTTEPQGILTALSAKASSFITTTGADINADDVINLYYSLRRPYRKNAVWLASDAAISHLRKLKDATQNFLWQNSLTESEPPTLLGAKVYSSPFMPAVESGQVPLLFGDFKNYFVIGDRGNRTVKRLDELYALSDCVGFLMLQRVDSRLTNDEAIKGLKIK